MEIAIIHQDKIILLILKIVPIIEIVMKKFTKKNK